MPSTRLGPGGTRSCFCLLLACFSAANFCPVRVTAAEVDTCSLAGSVRDSLTGAPLRTKVVLLPAGGRTTYMTATDSAGAFSFDSVEPGNYRIELQNAGYRSEPGNQAGALTHLSPGQKIAGLELTAVPLGAISGTILDAEGEPLVGAEVQLIRSKWSHGRRVVSLVQVPRRFFEQLVLTDDLGRYRLDSLEPGEYFVRAQTLPGWFNIETVSDGPGQPEMATIPMFYPRAVTIAGATPVRVGAGQEISGIDLRLPIVRTFHIRGSANPAPTDTITNRAPYVAASHDDGGVKDWAEFFGQFGEDGSFDIAGVPAGNYVVREMQGSEALSDQVRTSVNSGDVNGVRLSSTRFDVGLQVRFEGDASHDLSRVFAHLVPTDRIGATLSTWPNHPGVISNVSPGRYILEVSPDENAHVKQLLVHGKEVTSADFQLDGAADQLEIVLAKGTRTICGTFAWPDPRPIGVRAILVPEKPRPGGFTIVHQADIDQSGEFTFWSVSPGRYRSFVVTDFDEGLWENRDFFRLVSDRGLLVEVPEGAKDNSAIRISPALLPPAAVERAMAQMRN